MSVLIVLPILVPFAAAIACIIAWKSVLAQRIIATLAGAALLAAAVALLATLLHPAFPDIAAVQAGGWAAPFGITFVADILSAIMVLLNAIIGLATIIYALGAIDERREKFGFYPLLLALIASCSGAFLTGDIFNMFVWFEIMLMSSFALLALGSERAQLEGAIKYVTLNLISSAIFLTAVGVLYAMAGTLNMADLAVKLSDVDNPAAVTAVSVLFLAAFGIKAAVFPMFFWLPAAYHTCPPVVSAIFAGMLTKVGVYAMVRVFMLIFTTEPLFTHQLIIWIAGFTMVTGVLGAAVQGEIRRILSFHIISQIGYMIMGLGVGGVALARSAALEATDPQLAEQLAGAGFISIAGTVFYILHHIIVKSNLFFVAGVIQSIKGTNELKKIGGLYHARPFLAILFMIPAMSLAGIPILSGFWCKFALVRGGLQAEAYWIVAASLFVSILTLYSMTKIWAQAFWKPDPDLPDDEPHPDPSATIAAERTQDNLPVMFASITGLALITLAIGFGAGPAMDIAERSAHQLINREHYVRAVLGEDSAQIIARHGNWGTPRIANVPNQAIPVSTIIASDTPTAPIPSLAPNSEEPAP